MDFVAIFAPLNGIINLIIKHEKNVFVDGSPYGFCHRIGTNHR
ncbi:MAG: hypothetical protein RLZZ593_214 [Bacteroidota bacterium]